MAYDIFEKYIENILENYLEDTEIDDNLYLAELNEAAMSAEDRYDSDILRAIIDKTRERTNAKLTQEEKDILAKYGLAREDRSVIIPGEIRYYVTSDEDISNPRGGNKPERRSNRYNDRYHNDPTQVNYADIARKRGARDAARRAISREDQLSKWREDREEMRRQLHSRDYHQRQVDQGDDAYQKALEKARKDYEAALKRAENERDSIDTYHQPNLDRAKAAIDALLKR